MNGETQAPATLPPARYESPFVVVDALPPGYAARPAGEPERKTITFTLDGAEVQAPEGIMLVDAAKYGGVEIPVFCYEPKLGAPVGACRMCLVEIEGIPKLQTACSTPVRDGMAVVTRSPRVIEAQNGVVEFLLANHPLDCPVCDKGGECPLQDISYGWGDGRSRFTEPKRHFEKPLALSPSIAIDRERCILCYRCVRFSQELSEDHQLVLLDRGDGAYVGTFDGSEYIAPFTGNIIELCPVGALTSRAYRFRARPWDVEEGGSVCTLCPAQCNVKYTVRDERAMRVLARDNHGVDDGWLCDKGRFAHRAWESDARLVTPLVRQGDKLLPARWEHALDVAAAALAKAGARTAALAGGATTNEEAWLLRRLMLEGLNSGDFESRLYDPPPPEVTRALANPALTAAVPDVEWADALLVLDGEPVHEMPVLDLRIRKGVRRHGLKLAIAGARPSTLDGNAAAVARYAPGHGGAFVQALLAALGAGGDVDDLAARAGANADGVRDVAELLEGAERPVIVWSEGLAATAAGGSPVAALCNLAGRLRLGERAGAGLLQMPLHANGRGLAEAGFVSDFGGGLAERETPGKSAAEIRDGLGDEIGALILMKTDPLTESTDAAVWQRQIAKAASVISFTTWLDPAGERFADVVFPAETGPEQEGTVTHPDGRLQRLRQTVERAGRVNAGWWVIGELAKRLGVDLGVKVVGQATAQLAGGVGIYAGITTSEIGGTGVRWQDRPAAANLPAPAGEIFELAVPAVAARPDGRLRLAVFKTLWSGGEVAHSDVLRPLAAGPRRVELAPADGLRLGIESGDSVTLKTERGTLTADAALRDAIPAGTAFLQADGSDEFRDAIGAATELVEVVK